MEKYIHEEIKKYIKDIRLEVTKEEHDLTDEIVLSKIEEYVFSICKASCYSHIENSELIERIFLSLRSEMDILQPYMDDGIISEIMVNGKDDNLS